MDNSKEFKLMLDKAIEAHPEGFKGFDRTKNVQDQLQEMIRESGYTGFNGLKYFIRWLQNSEGGTYPFFRCQDNEEFPPFTSMEQLWLAFVMKERYSKLWNGEEWIKS